VLAHPSFRTVPDTRTASAPRVLRGDSETVAELLQRPGALLHGHFALLSGAHTDQFFAFSKLAGETEVVESIGAWLAAEAARWRPQGILAPTTAGVALAWTLACRLGLPLHLASLDDAGRADAVLGEPDLAGQRILLVNDIVTTGRGLRALADAVSSRGAEVCGAAWFLTRSAVDVEDLLGCPSAAVVEWDLTSWPAAECPHCPAGDEPEHAIDLN
jgi:orotate phosphoribosyltransferase